MNRALATGSGSIFLPAARLSCGVSRLEVLTACGGLGKLVAVINLLTKSPFGSAVQTASCAFLCGVTMTLCAATDYYVSTSGNDANAGTFSAPWRTLQKAATSIGAGDTCYIRGGSYIERVTISNRHGSAALPMTFASYPGETASIEQTLVSPPNGLSALLTISNSDFIIIRNIEFQNHKTSTATKDLFGIYIVGACNGVQLRGNKVHDIWQSATTAAGNAHGISVLGNAATAIDGLIIDGNEIHHCLTGSSETVTLNGNVTNFTVTNNLIHDCNNIGIDFIGGEGVNTNAALDKARNGVCSGNVIYNIDSAYNPAYKGTLGFAAPYGGYGSPVPNDSSRGAAGIYSDGGGSIIIERNLVYQCNIGVEVGCEHSGKFSTGIIVRNNMMHHNHVGGIFMGGAGTGGGATGCAFTNNTLYVNDTSAYGGGCIEVQDNVTTSTIKNNIMVCDPTGQQFILVTGTGSVFAAGSIDWNLYSGTTQSALEFIWNGVSEASYSDWLTGSGQDAHSIFTAAANTPLFTNKAANDYTLLSSSPAVNAGDVAFAPASGEKDFGGQSRVAGARVDIGADEFMTAAQAWRDLYFSLPNGGPNANAMDDPDKDGLPNLLEYALGGNPLQAGSAALPVPSATGGHGVLTFSRNLNAADLTFAVQASSDMASWTTIATKSGTGAWSKASGVTVSDPGTGVVSVTDSATVTAGSRRFLRLSVTQ
jgi:Right handed beta helix region